MAWPTDPLTVEVTLALGADLTADPSTWSFGTDITTYTFDRDGYSSIIIRRGRTDEATQAQPSLTRLTVNNTDGRFVDHYPLGAYFGSLRRNTPIRVRVNPGAGLDTRNVALTYEMPPQWDPSETDHFVPAVASGILRRLQQGATPLKSALLRAITQTTTPLAYWPLEDGVDAVEAGSGLPGGAPMRIRSGVVAFAAGLAAAGGLAACDLGSGTGSLEATVPAVQATSWMLDACLGFESLTASTDYPQVELKTPGAINRWGIETFTSSGENHWSLYYHDGTTLFSFVGTSNLRDGRAHHVRIAAAQDGTNIDIELFVDGVSEIAWTFAGTLTMPTKVTVNPLNATGNDIADVSHVAVWAPATLALDVASGAAGHVGELTGDRFARLCTEEGVPADVAAGSNQTMGVQTTASLMTLLRECEAAEAGLIVERRTGKLGFDPHTVRVNQAVALTLDYSSGHISPPLVPTDDDQRTRNDVTVTRAGGSWAQVVDETGPLGVAAIGRYDEGLTLNLETDGQAVQHAGWRVNLGTADFLRFPTVTLDLRRNSSLVAAWLALDIGDRVAITNLPNNISYDDIELIVEGYAEQISQRSWIVTLNCAPYAPDKVFELADTTADSSEFVGRLAGDDAAIRVAIDSDDTSILIDPNAFRWTLTADDFDPDLRVRFGGETADISTIGTTAATYVGRGAMSSADNAAVTPATTGFGAADGNLLLCLGRMRGTTGSLTADGGWELMAQVGNLYLWGHIRSGTTPITVTPSGGAAGDVVSATVFAFTNTSLTVDPPDMVLDSPVTQSNASAQDVAYPRFLPHYPGNVVLLLAGKSDDWTSVAVPAGFTESGEPTTTVGNDQSLYLAYQIQTTPALVPAGSLVVTGGAAAVSEVMLLAISAGYQTLTVSARSVNGVVKSHAVGTRIEAENAYVLGL